MIDDLFHLDGGGIPLTMWDRISLAERFNRLENFRAGLHLKGDRGDNMQQTDGIGNWII
jgi:hypothetical protein